MNNIDKIIKEACKHYDVSVDTLLSPARDSKTATCRLMCYLLITELLKLSTTTIGRHFSRDHSSVVHGKNKMRGLVEQSHNHNQSYVFLQQQLNHLRKIDKKPAIKIVPTFNFWQQDLTHKIGRNQ